MASVRLGDLCAKIGSGATPRGGKEVYASSGVAFIRSQNVYNDRFDHTGLVFIDEDAARALDGVSVEPCDVLLNITGESVGRCCLAPSDLGPARVSQHVMIVRPDRGKVDSAFLRYWFVSSPVQGLLGSMSAGGATRRALTKGMIEGLSATFPPLDAQRRIAAVLGALDDKIELNRKMSRTLEEMAQALFKSWFIDFDGYNPADLVDSEIGPIPRGWEVSTLRDHIRLDRGLSYKGEFLTKRGRPLVNLKCIRPHGGFRRDATKPYSGDFKERHVVVPGDLVVANTDLTQARDILGCPAIVPNMPGADTIITSHHTFAVRFEQRAEVSRFFVYHLLLGRTARDRCRGFATGTTVLAMPQDALLDLEFALPSSSAVASFERMAETLFARIALCEDEAATLAELRDTLLPKLISGEIRLQDPDRFLDEVTG
jgi:type I restriction enzyme, S subunit